MQREDFANVPADNHSQEPEEVTRFSSGAQNQQQGAVAFSAKPTRANLPPVSESLVNLLISQIDGVRQAAGDARIIMVNAPSDLPAEILKQAKAQNVPENEIHGVLHKGRAYIVRQNLKGAQDVEEVLSHEILGHGGVNALLGNKKHSVLLEAFNRAGGLMGTLQPWP